MMTKVIFIGISGATCSGKTTLAKHLFSLLPDSVILHQDDFAPPQDLIPIHPVHNIQDWDAAEGAISWARLVNFLKTVKRTGEVPPDHRSHDHLNEHKEIKVDDGVREKWISEFARLKKENKGEQIVWALVDGFLLYWYKEVIDQLDVRIMLRVPHDVLAKRRHERHGYHTAVQTDPEGTLWRDPPGYWENIVWPAYVDAHKGIFENGDVEHGKLTGVIEDLVLLETLEISLTEAVERSCQAIHGIAQEVYGVNKT